MKSSRDVAFWMAVGLTLLVSCLGMYRYNSKNPNTIIEWDGTHYYAYLPAVFIHDSWDLTFVAKNSDYYSNKVGRQWVRKGVWIPKMTSGLAICYAPFFFTAHVYQKITGGSTDGYSKEYQKAIFIAGVVWSILGIWILLSFLRRYFDPDIVAGTLLIITLGTNWLNYAVNDVMMSHTYTFTLACAYLLNISRWYHQPKLKYLIYIGFFGGWIALIRPVNALYVIPFLFFGLGYERNIKEQLNLFWTHRWGLILAGGIAFCFVMLQMIYWKKAIGEWYYYSYQDEGFFWSNPQIWKGVFGFRKGWLIYTPLMWCAIAGFVLILKNKKLELLKVWGWWVMPFMSLVIYVLFSWWCWFYGGGYSCRPMIDYYPLWSIGIGALLLFLKNSKYQDVRYGTVTVLAWLVFFNLFQTEQYWKGILSSQAMNYRAYKAILWEQRFPEGIDTLYKDPDYQAAQKGLSE